MWFSAEIHKTYPTKDASIHNAFQSMQAAHSVYTYVPPIPSEMFFFFTQH